MFRTHPITVVRIAAIALVLYYLLNLSSESIKVSTALQQRHYLLRDLLRYFLLLLASLGFLKVYQASLGHLGKWVLGFAIFTSMFGIAAYVCLSLNLLLVLDTTWQTSLLAFFEFLKGELVTQFQTFVSGKQSLASWLSNWFTQLQVQFIPQASDFPTGRGWIKLYLLFKLLASIFLKLLVIFGCGMFLFARPLSKQNLLVASLILLWLLSPIFGRSVTMIWGWIFNIKAVNGEAVRSMVALSIMFLIAVRMWLDAPSLKTLSRAKAKKKLTVKSSKKVSKTQSKTKAISRKAKK